MPEIHARVRPVHSLYSVETAAIAVKPLGNFSFLNRIRAARSAGLAKFPERKRGVFPEYADWYET